MADLSTKYMGIELRNPVMVGAYSHYQIEREEQPLDPGEAFPMVQKLLRINHLLNLVGT